METNAAEHIPTRLGEGVIDKVKRYGWSVVDEPGQFRLCSKHDLRIDDSYQREQSKSNVAGLRDKWSWLACGSLTVVKRGDGYLWVIDGGHRLAAAMPRSDIQLLPCMVFDEIGLASEAAAFVRLNTNRKAVSAVAKFRAALVAGDETALRVQEQISSLGLFVGSTGSVNAFTATHWAVEHARDDFKAFSTVICMAAYLARNDGIAVQIHLLRGLWYLHKNFPEGLLDTKLAGRLRGIGAAALLRHVKSYAVESGAKSVSDRTAGLGMFGAVNAGLRNKMRLKNREHDHGD